MHLIERYSYRQLERVTYPNGARHYICPDSGKKLPSVTTILSRTADHTGLDEWRRRVGEKKAEQERKDGTALGSLMHTHLEKYMLGEARPGGNNYFRLMAEHMADQIIQRGLPDLNEIWGSEIHLWASHLFAGTADGVGLYRGKPAIFDFKTAKKLRKREMIDDYFHQLGAYGLAHDELHGTRIQTGVIFMVSRDCDYQKFVIEGEEFLDYQNRFLRRFEQFLADLP